MNNYDSPALTTFPETSISMIKVDLHIFSNSILIGALAWKQWCLFPPSVPISPGEEGTRHPMISGHGAFSPFFSGRKSKGEKRLRVGPPCLSQLQQRVFLPRHGESYPSSRLLAPPGRLGQISSPQLSSPRLRLRLAYRLALLAGSYPHYLYCELWSSRLQRILPNAARLGPCRHPTITVSSPISPMSNRYGQRQSRI